MRATRHSNSRASGFTLVETMVALLVLAVGMLGVASLYVVSLKSGASAINRMHAVNLASDLADRIRANRFAGSDYAAAGASNACVGAAVTCSPQQLAAFDIFSWQAQIASLLPGGATGSVVFTAGAAGNPNTYKIKVTWAERDETLFYELQTQI